MASAPPDLTLADMSHDLLANYLSTAPDCAPPSAFLFPGATPSYPALPPEAVPRVLPTAPLNYPAFAFGEVFALVKAFGLATFLLLVGLIFSAAFFGEAAFLVGETLLFVGLLRKSSVLILPGFIEYIVKI